MSVLYVYEYWEGFWESKIEHLKISWLIGFDALKDTVRNMYGGINLCPRWWDFILYYGSLNPALALL